MVHQNEKRAMKSATVCSGAGPGRHTVLPLRAGFLQYLQFLLVLTLCAGFALSTETTLVPTTQSGQEVIYTIEVTVNVNGSRKNEQDIIDWLEPVFQNNLQICGPPVSSTTSAPTFSTSAFPTNMTVTTTLENNMTTTDVTTTDVTTTATTTAAATTATSQPTTTTGAATTTTTSQPKTTITTTAITSTIATTTTVAATTTPTTNPSTSTSTVTTPATPTGSTTTLATTSKTEQPTTTSKSTSTVTRTTQSPSATTAQKDTTTAAQTRTSVLSTVTPLEKTPKGKPSNNPNPNAAKSLRIVREIRATPAGIFKDFKVDCEQKLLIRRTTCLVFLTLKEPVNPCCILQTLCNASQSSTTITVTGTRADRGELLSPSPTPCSNPPADACVYEGPTGPTCVDSEEAYSVVNTTQCGTENKCICSTYCSGNDAYYIFNISTENPLSEIQLSSMLSFFTTASECLSSPGCPLPGFVSKYKDGTVLSCNTGLPLKCTVAVAFTEEVPICPLSDLAEQLLNNRSINMEGPLTRAAICGNPEPVSGLPSSSFSLIDVNLSPDQFCTRYGETKISNCQAEQVVYVKLDERCDPTPTVTTTTPITTTSLQANTTLSANVTINTTATTNTTSTPVNETTTVAPTTSGSSSDKANALLDNMGDPSKLNSSQVDQLVSQLENLLSGPSVSKALGNTSVQIVSNLLSAPLEAVDNSKNRIMGIVDTVGEKVDLTETSESILTADLALSVQQADGTNFKGADFSISDPNNVQVGFPRSRRAVKEGSSVPQGSITLPPTLTQNLTAEQQQMVSRVQFNFYQKSTLFQDKAMGDRILNSGILGASAANVTISGLQDDVIIYLRNIQPVPANYVATCVFWDFKMNDRSGGWNSTGCKVKNSTDIETICGCNHLTSFGILLDLSREPIISRTQATILTFITYIGCGVSAIFLAITLLTYLAFGKLRKDIPSKILIHLCLSLLLLNLVFLVDAWLALFPDAVGLCISTAWFLHYFLLVAFTWMGLEAVHMYIALVKVFNSHISHYMLKFSLAGWGIPMIVVIIVIAIDKNNYGLVSYGKFSDGTTDEFCWIKNDVAFYVAVVAYFCLIFLFNMVMFIVVLVQLRRLKKQNPHNVQHRTTFQDVRSVLGITILLGLTWGFAFFAWGPLNLPFMYLFAIFNSLQGFFIFVFHCAVKDNVRRQWRTYLCCGRMRLAENSEWSRTATQKTAKKSSVTRITSLHSSKSNNSSGSSSYLVSESSDQMNGFGSPFSDRTITADEDPSMDVILNDINNQYRRL